MYSGFVSSSLHGLPRGGGYIFIYVLLLFLYFYISDNEDSIVASLNDGDYGCNYAYWFAVLLLSLVKVAAKLTGIIV